MQLSMNLLEKSDRNNKEFHFYIYRITSSDVGQLIPPHWHEELEILFFESDGVAELNGVQTPFQAGDIIFANKEVIHHIKFHSVGANFAIVFDYSFLDFALMDYCQNEILNNLKINKLIFPDKLDKTDEIYTQVHELLAEVIDLFYSDSLARELKIKCNLYHIIYLFYSQNKLVITLSNAKPSNHFTLHYIKDAISYMEQNYPSNITLDDLSKHAKVSRFYLIKIFKQFAGMSPIEYLINLRIEHSSALLKNECSISCACYEVGFNNISYFIKKFKKKYGLTPREYKTSFSLQNS